MRTPWGPSQSVTPVCPGIADVATAGHGGLYVSSGMDSHIRPLWRQLAQRWAPAGWYEEDSCWALVALTFPQHFSAAVLADARQAVAWMEARATQQAATQAL